MRKDMHAFASLPLETCCKFLQVCLRSSTWASERTSVRANVRTNLFQIGVTEIIMSRKQKNCRNGNETVSSCTRQKKKNLRPQYKEPLHGVFLYCFAMVDATNESILNVMWWCDRKTHTRKFALPAQPVQTVRWSPGGGDGGETNPIFTGSKWPLAT